MLIGIFGTGRNGSTLINKILDGIPKTYVHPIEMNFLGVWSDLASQGRVSDRTVQNATTRPLKGLSRSLGVEPLVRFYSYQEDEIRTICREHLQEDIPLGRDVWAALRSRREYGVREFVEAYLAAMSDWTGDGRPAENAIFKTIEVPYIRDYEALFPDMRFVHIIRNPLDTYSSTKRSLMCTKGLPSWYLGGDNLRTVIDYRWLPHAEVILERSADPRHRVVLYEDLVADPLGVVTGLCGWLGLPLPANPTKQTVLGGRMMKKLPANSSKKGVETPVDVVSNLGQKFNYEDVLTGRERGFIAYKARRPAAEIGYELPEVGALGLALAWVLPDRWEGMHARTFKDRVKSCLAFLRRRWHVFSTLLAGKSPAPASRPRPA